MSVVLLDEHMSELERTFTTDAGWRRISAQGEMDFTRDALGELVKVSRALYLSSPLIKRAIDVTSYYTWAQGVMYKAKDDRVQELVVDALTEDEDNGAEYYSHNAKLLTDVDLLVNGSIYIGLDTKEDGRIELFSIPMDEIKEIYTKPGRLTQVQFFRRVWTERKLDLATGQHTDTGREALYPNWRYVTDMPRPSIGGVEVLWDQPICYLRTGALKHMPFGLPTTYAAMDWARAYKNFLENWHTLVASLARFAWKQTTKTRHVADRAKELSKQPEAAGGIAVVGDADDLTPIPKTGAHTSANDARPSRLMVAAATGLPDTILSGDADIGNFATSKTLDRPTELMMTSRQAMWRTFEQAIFKYQTRALQDRGLLPMDVDPRVEISFPDILEHDQEMAVKAIVSAATLNGQEEAGTIPQETVSRMLMEAIGVEDIQEALKHTEDREREDLTKAAEALSEAARSFGAQ